LRRNQRWAVANGGGRRDHVFCDDQQRRLPDRIGGRQRRYGTIHSGGLLTVLSGGTANSSVISNGGNEAVLAGGSAGTTTINSGGALSVFGWRRDVHDDQQRRFAHRACGGGRSFTTVSFGGTETVFSGGTAFNTTVNASGFAELSRLAQPPRHHAKRSLADRHFGSERCSPMRLVLVRQSTTAEKNCIRQHNV